MTSFINTEDRGVVSVDPVEEPSIQSQGSL